MFLQVKKYAKDFFKNIFLFFVGALMVAGVAWVLCGFLFELPVSFPRLFRVLYIAFLGIDVLNKVCGFFRDMRLLKKTMQRFGFNKATTVEALFVHELHAKRGFEHWNITEFRRQLVIARALNKVLG